MAIPFLPNNDENTSSEEQLMYQLYVTLHNALRSRNAHHPSRNRELCAFIRTVFSVSENYMILRFPHLVFLTERDREETENRQNIEEWLTGRHMYESMFLTERALAPRLMIKWSEIIDRWLRLSWNWAIVLKRVRKNIDILDCENKTRLIWLFRMYWCKIWFIDTIVRRV